MSTFYVDAWKALLNTVEAMAPDYDPETRVSLNKFVDQLPSVFNQVILCGLAILDFKRLVIKMLSQCCMRTIFYSTFVVP